MKYKNLDNSIQVILTILMFSCLFSGFGYFVSHDYDEGIFALKLGFAGFVVIMISMMIYYSIYRSRMKKYFKQRKELSYKNQPQVTVLYNSSQGKSVEDNKNTELRIITNNKIIRI